MEVSIHPIKNNICHLSRWTIKEYRIFMICWKVAYGNLETIESKNVDIYNDDIEKNAQAMQAKANESLATLDNKSGPKKEPHSLTDTIAHIRSNSWDSRPKRSTYFGAIVRTSSAVIGEDEDLATMINGISQQIDELNTKYDDLISTQHDLELRVDTIKYSLVEAVFRKNRAK